MRIELKQLAAGTQRERTKNQMLQSADDNRQQLDYQASGLNSLGLLNEVSGRSE